MSTAKSTVSVLLLLAYIGVAVFGISAGTHREHGSIRCPYAIGQHSLCTMNFLEHMKAWQDATAGVPSLWWMLFVTIVSMAIASVLFIALLQPVMRTASLRGPPSLMEQLFSKGILHPKAP